MPDVAPQPTSPLPWWATAGIGYLITLAFIAISVIIVWRADDKYEQMIIVAMVAAVSAVTGYYYGSSSGSQAKDSQTATTLNALTGAAGPSSSLTAALAESQAAHQ